MKTLRWIARHFLAVGLLLIAGTSARAFWSPPGPELSNFDRRTGGADVAAATNQQPAVSALHALLPDARIDFDEHTGTPKWIVAGRGFLSDRGAQGRGIGAAAARAINAGEEHRATKAFLQEHQTLFGFGPEILTTARLKQDSVTAHNGLRTVIWEQELDGIAVFEGLLISHTTPSNELVNLSSRFLPNPTQAADTGTPNRAAKLARPPMTAARAVALAGQNLEEALDETTVTAVESQSEGAERRQHFRAPPLNGDAEAKLVWLPMNQSSLRLCWEVVLTSRARGEMFRVLIDAQTGEALVRHRLTEYLSDASFRVFTSDSPSPFSPGHPTPSTTQPPIVARSLVTWGALDTNASPAGWINDGGNETWGNNVDAHTDRDANDTADLPRPQGSPFRTFDFTLDLTQAPSTYTNAATTDLFYWCNWMHDKLYALGFTEAGRNFQSNNFARGGLGNDAVQADAQDGSGFNNANMSTPSDGSPPRMQMYLFSGPTPDRDGDLDHEIVLHEYTHGLSNRRVGGGVGLSALQSRGMGEGWSDWYGLSLLSEPGDDVNGTYAAGGYATYQFSGLLTNYYFGIRRYPYSTDMTKNPLTFKDIDPAQATLHPGIPRSPIIGTTADEVHNSGEVWCATLWEARAELVTKYGHATGNDLILRLVTDGMNLSPANPNFLQARDAILQADVVYNGGADLGELWQAFAKRGMGANASSPSSSTTVGLVEAYNVPDNLTVSPATGFTSSGPVGGPFTQTSVNYLLGNVGTNSLNWTGSRTAIWLNLSLTSGTLAAGATTQVNVSLDASASSLVAGIYTNTVRFTNVTSGVTQSRAFILRVGQPEFFTELFDAADNDLDNGTLTFTPDGTTNFYSICREPTSAYATDPAGGANLSLNAHSFVQLNLTNNISIYGRSTNVIFVNAEGHVTLVAADTSGSVSLVNHFARPRVSALCAHIHPIESGGTVTWLQLSNRIAITFNRVVEYATANTNSFQFELFYDGRIRMTHLALGTTTGLVGISAGNGVPAGFQESDLSSFGPCVLPLAITVPHTVTEGDGTLVGQGLINLFAPAPTNLTFNLTSSDTSEVTVPATVTVLTGMTSTNFDLTILDDPDLDGVQPTTISATQTGYAVGADIVQVGDNETAALTVTVPGSLTEGGAPNAGSVTASAAPVANITVSLASSDTTEILVPSSVQILAGQTSAVFNVTIVNDTQIDGDQNATVTAHVPNWTDGLGNIVVHDNEPTNLIVTLPASAREGNGVLVGAGGVRISGTLPTNLVVALLSSDTTELTVPPTATILAGQTNAAFNLTIVDDPDIDSSQGVTVTASASGFSNGATNMTVTDDESPLEPFNPSPAHLATNVIQTSDLAWQSGAVAGEVITNDVYFGTSPVPGPAELLGSTTNTSWILPTLAPQTTFYWQIVARKAGITPGPVWRFTTRGLDHFVWDTIPSTQYVSQPFPVKVTAKDAFDTTVSNSTAPVQLRASAGGGSPASVIEDFESATWPHAPWTGGSGGVVSTTHAHDGTYGLSDPEWPYRTDVQIGNAGDVLTCWVRQNVSGSGRAYFGFGASASGAWSLVLAPNTSQFLIQQNAGYGYADVAIVSQTWQASKWYKATVQFLSGSVVRGCLYDSDGTTLLNSLSVSNVTGLPGGVALRSFGSMSFDTIASGGDTGSIPTTPTNSGNFADGTWTGNVTVMQPSTGLVLRADDGSGHTGLSSPFVVELQNDIGVSVTDSPDPVSTGANVTYAITVTNIGPASANNVIVTNVLPLPAALVSVTTSQGSATTNGNLVICALNTLGGNSFATVTIVATLTNAGTFTNRTFVARAETDPYLANNSAVATTTAQNPVITLNDKSVGEGNTGTTTAAFTVTVSPAPGLPTSVNFATASSTAVAPGDFISTNGTLTFAPGETNKTIFVTINGDAFYELNETFTVNLTAATNATIADSQGIGTILNDDPMPTLSVSDVTVVERNFGATNVVFNVSLSTVSGVNTIFGYSTVNGSATAGSDYTAVSGTLTILAGMTSTNIVVPVNGDLNIETDEVFYLDLSGPANAILLKREGVGLIVNDDGLPGDLHHFVWTTPGTPPSAGLPFNVSIAALDVFENPANNFTGVAYLSATDGLSGTNTILGNLLHSSVSSGTYTFGYGFTPNTNLTVTHVRSYYGTKVSIWTDAGVLLASQPVSGTLGTWTETPLASPLVLNAGTAYRIGVYTGGGSYYWRLDGTNSFANGVINQSYELSGDGFPSSVDSARWWFVDLKYAIGNSEFPLTPIVTTPFSGAMWSGPITAFKPATNLTLRADDADGHFGLSSPMVVELRDDIAVIMTNAPTTVAIGGYLTNVITVTNTGPSTATGVTATNYLPASVSFVSATASQGTCVPLAGRVECALGSLGAGGVATVAVVTIPGVGGALTNQVFAGRSEADPLLINNSAVAVAFVQLPALSINNVSIAEGNSGEAIATFNVSMTPAPATNVSVNFATADVTATAGSDYFPTNGLFTFAPGETNRSLAVRIFGDTNAEPSETFSITLTTPTNASLGNAVGIGTIVNDDLSGRVAVFGAPSTTTWNSDVATKIAASGNFSQVDSFLLTAGNPVPTLAQLQQYGAVLIYSDTAFNNATDLGNVLADYADAGGGVVVCTFAFSVSIQGRFNTGGYLPFTIGSQDQPGNLTLVKDLPSHDILSGVVSFNGGPSSYHNTVALSAGSVLVAHWSNNRPLVGTKEDAGHRVVGLNFYPPSSSVRSDFWLTNTHGGLLMANALGWAARSGPNTNPPTISQQPADQTVFAGATATFNVGASGSSLNYQWRKELIAVAGATNSSLSIPAVQTNAAGNYSVLVSNPYGAVTSAVAVLTVLAAPTNADFQIVALLTNNSLVMEHDAQTGDDRGGIAASASQLLYSGDASTARFALANLSGGTALGQIFDALVSDLRSGQIYSLANGTTPLTSSGGTVTTLLEHDGSTGLLNGNSITLSAPISLIGNYGNVGIFAGYGRVVLHSGSRVYDISLPSGIVTDLGPMSSPTHTVTENWAYWGVAEYTNGIVSLVYVQNSQAIARTAVPAGTTTVLASFGNLSDMAAITVSPINNRWYFHHEGGSQFGGSSETVGYADALFSLTSTNSPPTITTQPASQTVAYGGSATLGVQASGVSPLSYQWRKQGVPLAGATSTNLAFSNAQFTNAGNYDVVVTNLYGAVTSAVAVLTVATALPVVINFDEFSAPCSFINTVRLTNRYAALGALFNGPGGLDGGAILGDCGGFGVLGYSPPNFLAFNSSAPMSDGGIPRGPETILFPGLVSNVQLKIGSGDPGVGTLLAYNTNNVLLTSNSVTMNNTLQTLRASATGIARITISSSSLSWVVDDISFTPMSLSPGNPTLVFQSVELLGGLMKLTLGTADASPITTQRASNVWVYASTDLTLPLANWTALTIAPVLTNGVLILDGINTANPPVRYFRAIEGAWTVQPLRLQVTPSAGGGFGFDAGNADGSPLTPMRAARMQIYSTTNFTLPFAAWEQLNVIPALSNGVLHVNGPPMTNGPARFFRMVETP